MLAIRLQRTGRKGHSQFRFVVQDSRQSPKSGRVVALLGNYDPHTKTAQFDKNQTATFLKNGARPSDKVARILKKEGVKLPDWVSIVKENKREIRNPEKLRRNRPAGTEAPAAAEPEPQAEGEDTAKPAPAEEAPAEAPAAETPEVAAPEEPVAEAAEKPADEPAA